jgi:hypothetical protein
MDSEFASRMVVNQVRKCSGPQYEFEPRFTDQTICPQKEPSKPEQANIGGLDGGNLGPRSAYAVNMSKQQKVVPIRKEASSPIDSGPDSFRILVSIGGQRFAIDFLTRISSLPSATVDRTGDILPMKKK